MKNLAFMAAALFSLLSFADAYHYISDPQEYKSHLIYVPDAQNIKLTITMTQLLDGCNDHGMMGDVYQVQGLENFYYGQFGIMSTEMACGPDDVPVLKTFTTEKIVTGPSLDLLLPANIEVVAEEAVKL